MKLLRWNVFLFVTLLVVFGISTFKSVPQTQAEVNDGDCKTYKGTHPVEEVHDSKKGDTLTDEIRLPHRGRTPTKKEIIGAIKKYALKALEGECNRSNRAEISGRGCRQMGLFCVEDTARSRDEDGWYRNFKVSGLYAKFSYTDLRKFGDHWRFQFGLEELRGSCTVEEQCKMQQPARICYVHKGKPHYVRPDSRDLDPKHNLVFMEDDDNEGACVEICEMRYITPLFKGHPPFWCNKKENNAAISSLRRKKGINF